MSFAAGTSASGKAGAAQDVLCGDRLPVCIAANEVSVEVAFAVGDHADRLAGAEQCVYCRGGVLGGVGMITYPSALPVKKEPSLLAMYG